MFNALKSLSDDCLVYYEPVINDKYPDFIVIVPDLGVIVIEVKGWFPKHIVDADSNDIYILWNYGKSREKHPVRQARDYMCNLMNECRKHPATNKLLHHSGLYENKFIFPLGYFAILSNITKQQLVNHKCGDLTNIFRPERNATRDLFLEWELEKTDQRKLRRILRPYFKPFWKITPLNKYQINVLRAVIHPETWINSQEEQMANATCNKQYAEIKVLDLRQEESARKIGRGHRILYGIAGSGKTVILIARARLLSEDAPESRVLLTCYNC